MDNTRIQYLSKFIPDVVTTIIFKDDPEYDIAEKHFKVCGFGFMVPDGNHIIIDGEKLINQDLLYWIEAHEASHYLLNHTSEYDPQEEIEADLGAYILMRNFGYDSACELVVTHFNQRHKIDFPKEQLIEIVYKLGSYTFHEEFF